MPASLTNLKQPAPELTHDAYLSLQIDRIIPLKAHGPCERTKHLISKVAGLSRALPPPVLCIALRDGHGRREPVA